MSEFFGSALTGALGAGIVGWLFRKWISERLKQSISHEYSIKLEVMRNDLGAKLEAVKHIHEVDQLRTSLFFDHQRLAFGEILAKIVDANREWSKLDNHEYGIFEEPVPAAHRLELEALYFKHQLFLDSDLIMAMQLLFEVYSDAVPFYDGEREHARDADLPYSNAMYLQPRLAALFRLKIGVGNDRVALRQIALFGAMRILNSGHFPEAGIPVGEPLRMTGDAYAQKAVARAEARVDDVVAKMKAFQAHLQQGGFFTDREASLRRYIDVLDQPKAE